jgi:GNAT superfamily N-acetyltransferase
MVSDLVYSRRGVKPGRKMLDKESYVFDEVLRDGTPVTLRAARSDDGSKILQAFRKLRQETVYTRFFGYKSDVSDVELKRITDGDFSRDVALLVTIGSGEEEVVIGGASYFSTTTAPQPHSAELAFTVEDDYQGLGVASLLMRYMVNVARKKKNKLKSLEADVLASNLPMLAVFRHSGLPMELQHDGDVVHVTLSLQAEIG